MDDGWKTAGRLLEEDAAVRQALGASPHETTKQAAERLADAADDGDDDEFVRVATKILQDVGRVGPRKGIGPHHLFCQNCSHLVDDKSEAGLEPAHAPDTHCRSTCLGFRARRLLERRK